MATEHVTVMLMVALMALSAPSHCQVGFLELRY